ncbi:MAG TPA: acetyl-CoA carboxylase biotin carboxyl carrier protein subunit [Stellaceae bacterium]|nr:acetyl-CoA carboxylase biotin carboxyl carrier protein subunit [Stellaceae bacterium]
MRFGGRRPSPLSPDPDLIRSLAQLLEDNGLTEIEYAVGDRMIRVSRGLPMPTTAAAPIVPAPAAPVPSPGADTPAIHPGAVTAPMVGTAYLASQPDAPVFVREGEMVETGQPLMIIEAMKVMNEIRAPRAGRLSRILVEDGQPVEYGMVLMLIE